MYFCKSIIPAIDLPCKKNGFLDIETGTKEEWGGDLSLYDLRAQGSELEGGLQAMGSSI
jgi:hypothetical protein